LKFFVQYFVGISHFPTCAVSCWSHLPSFNNVTVLSKVTILNCKLYITGSVSLGWQKVWARSRAQPRWRLMRCLMKKKTTCWPRGRAAMSMIDDKPQMYTWLFLHWLLGCFKIRY
jgi:hypothetical protein